jgi:hypothetical protein
VPTAKPNLRNKIAPSMVEIAVKNTAPVPNLPARSMKNFFHQK